MHVTKQKEGRQSDKDVRLENNGYAERGSLHSSPCSLACDPDWVSTARRVFVWAVGNGVPVWVRKRQGQVRWAAGLRSEVECLPFARAFVHPQQCCDINTQ